MVNKLKRFARNCIQPINLGELLRSLPPEALILDVGCGNHSPARYKNVNPDTRYYGLDIAEYNLSAADYALAEEIRFVESSAFDKGVLGFGKQFDLIISSHNLEHVDQPESVLEAMASSLSVGGKLWLAFPSQRSVGFPSRGGCLNFFDDDTHKRPVNEAAVLQRLHAHGLSIRHFKPGYRPMLPYLVGAVQEPFSRLAGHIFSHTWSFWGFETIVVAQRNPAESPQVAHSIESGSTRNVKSGPLRN